MLSNFARDVFNHENLTYSSCQLHTTISSKFLCSKFLSKEKSNFVKNPVYAV